MIGKKEQKNSMYTNFIKHMKKPNIEVILGQKKTLKTLATPKITVAF